jgi:hypothetical protein
LALVGILNSHRYVLVKSQVHLLGYWRVRHGVVVASVNLKVFIRLENHVRKRKRFRNFFLVLQNMEDGRVVEPSVVAPKVSLGVILGYTEKVSWSQHWS